MKKITLIFVFSYLGRVFPEVTLNKTLSASSSSCGEVFLEKEFVLQSQDYPKSYPANFNCHFLLKSPNCSSNYKFEFLDFNLENSLGCTKDRLEIGKQDALCGNKTGSKMYSPENGFLRLNFKTDSSGFGKGFRILVRRMPCEEVQEATTEIQYEWTSKSVTQQPRTFGGNQCCSPLYNSSKFILISPNFPLSVSKNIECAYTIKKASYSVCRLRIHFKFFFLGTPSYSSCPYGYLQIDGKLICGCNDNLKLTTTFTERGEKILRFKSNGNSINSYTGFVLEVIQDECPKRYLPENSEDPESVVIESADNFKFYNDRNNNVAFPRQPTKRSVERLNLLSQKSSKLANIMKYFYFFSAPDDDNNKSVNSNDKEETTYIETSEINSIKTNYYNYNECLNWNQLQFNQITTRFGNSLGTCRRDDVETAQSSSNCIELNQIRGFFQSPGYPFYYPGNINVCYRLRRQSGFCDVRIKFVDFLLEKSPDCRNDYILLANGNKYCGGYLAGKASIFSTQTKPHIDMRFVTDSLYCGRGFKVVYEQIPCHKEYPTTPTEPGFPMTPPEPDYSDYYPPPEYTSGNQHFCGADAVVKEKLFILVATAKNSECKFRIEKNSQDICKVKLVFEKVDLICTIESLVIDGTMYCGRLNGRIVIIEPGQEITYRNMDTSLPGTRLKIIGHQISEKCPPPSEPPAQRLLELTPPKLGPPLIFNVGSNAWKRTASKFLIKTSNQHFKDICKTLKTTADDDIPEAVCQLISNIYNVTRCFEIPENHTSLHRLKAATNGSMVTNQTREILGEIDCDKY